MNKLSIAFLAAVSIASFGCKKKGGAGEAMAKMTEFKDKMCACKDSKCATGVQEEMTKWSQEMAKNAGDKKPEPMSEDDQKKYTEATTKMAECAQKAMSADAGGAAGSAAPAGGEGSAAPAGGEGSAAPAGGEGSAAAAPAGGGGDLPAECKDYQAAIEALAKCDKLPQATRDALKQSYEQTSAAWASVPAEGRAALGTACKSAADAVKQSAAACN
ncbi:MAG: hypothetical protein JNL83_30475 [Myxococcales bacterium]|nr:hypothetical protein [Myxococcales bacterium]